MKNYLWLVLLLPFFVSCGGRESAGRLAERNDSLTQVVMMKDSVMNDIFLSMNQIAENLNAITKRENVLSSDIGSGEIRKQTTARISEDIAAIDGLLLQNRETIEQLRRSVSQLNQANVKIAGLEKLITELNTQIETKDQEIGVLRQSLKNMQIEVAELNQRVGGLNTLVTGLEQENTDLEIEVQTTTDQLHAAYYIVGSEKELMEKEIIYKRGFIGRTVKINENRSLESFTQVDTRSFDAVFVNKKKATLVSTHPAEAYEFHADGQGNFEALVITDKERFWEYSKVLVISYK